MATQEPDRALEGFTTPSLDGSNSSNPSKIDLDPGEHIVGRITGYKPGAGANGLVEIDGRPLWLNKTMNEQLIRALVEDQTIAHIKEDRQESFTDSDGNVQTYHPRRLSFKDEGGD